MDLTTKSNLGKEELEKYWGLSLRYITKKSYSYIPYIFYLMRLAATTPENTAPSIVEK